MGICSSLLIATASLLFTVSSLSAQAVAFVPDSLREGLRIRLHAPGSARYPNATGTITRVLADSGAFFYKDDYDKGVRRIPVARLAALQVSEGKGITRGRLLAGAGVGFVAGLGLAQLIDFRHDDSSNVDCSNFLGACTRSRSMILGTLTGTGLGIAIAALKPGERWRSVSLR